MGGDESVQQKRLSVSTAILNVFEGSFGNGGHLEGPLHQMPTERVGMQL